MGFIRGYTKKDGTRVVSHQRIDTNAEGEPSEAGVQQAKAAASAVASGHGGSVLDSGGTDDDHTALLIMDPVLMLQQADEWKATTETPKYCEEEPEEIAATWRRLAGIAEGSEPVPDLDDIKFQVTMCETSASFAEEGKSMAMKDENRAFYDRCIEAQDALADAWAALGDKHHSN